LGPVWRGAACVSVGARGILAEWPASRGRDRRLCAIAQSTMHCSWAQMQSNAVQFCHRRTVQCSVFVCARANSPPIGQPSGRRAPPLPTFSTGQPKLRALNSALFACLQQFEQSQAQAQTGPQSLTETVGPKSETRTGRQTKSKRRPQNATKSKLGGAPTTKQGAK